MCGICGVVDFERRVPVAPTVLQAMSEAIRHRGPDEHGLHVESHAALAVRRLRIIDLATGQQPMMNEDESVWVVFNGEIYNFNDLRGTLLSRGHIVRTKSDTEVIVHAYEEFGENCLVHLRGMFAFALWDRKKRRFLLARDRVGIKPVYYHLSANRIAFASELKALLRVPELRLTVDAEALDLYVSYGYIPSPHTIFREIKKLPPAHYLLLERDRSDLKCYWDYVPSDTRRLPLRAYCEELRWRLTDAVNAHMISDVPVGAFLSGGLDSSTVVALMTDLAGDRVKTFSIGFPERSHTELSYARLAAHHFGTDHREFVLGPETPKILPEVISSLDEPFGDSSAIPTYLVSKFAAEHVKVVLCGDGGDELFGGYEWQRRYQMTSYLAMLPQPIRRHLPAAGAVLSLPLRASTFREKFQNFFRDAASSPETGYLRRMTLFDESARRALWSPEFRLELNGWDSRGPLRQWLRKHQDADFRTQMMYADLHFYCPEDCLTKVDRMSMAWSIEARVPFLDHHLVEFMATVPPDLKLRRLTSKYLLRQTVRNLLPAPILTKRKQGFSVPLAAWFRVAPLRDLATDLLLDARAQRAWFEPAIVGRILQEHMEGRRDHAHRLWALVVLELWARQNLDRVPAIAQTG